MKYFHLPFEIRVNPHHPGFIRVQHSSDYIEFPMLRKTFFFDRDGIVNQRIMGGYVTSPDEFVLLQDFLPLFRLVKEAGFLTVLITNQQGIGKGLMTESDLVEIHAQMQEQLASKVGSGFDDIYFAGERDLSSRSGCCGDILAGCRRKPSPAMLLEADERWGIDFVASWMIGDSISDAEAGKAAGTRTILVGKFFEGDADVIVPSLKALLPQMPSLLASGVTTQRYSDVRNS
ncbi:MAG: HAD-IIIA family hydrolase [Candidatus Kapabacteria bacterium]|nr:HAD-IIIA family hydrolase [Candidatus Kapabacteria bacterium]